MQKPACSQIITPDNPYKPIVCCTSRAPTSEDRGDSQILKKDPYTLFVIRAIFAALYNYVIKYSKYHPAVNVWGSAQARLSRGSDSP